MIWLAWHMWLLLSLAFLLGLFCGWWVFSGRAFHRHGHDDDLPEDQHAQDSKTPPVFSGNDLLEIQDTPYGPPPPVTPDTGEHQISPVMPRLYDTPEKGPPDDLKKISGIGERYGVRLNEMGIYYYEQIAGWNAEEVAWLDWHLGFPGRIRREKWQEQARLLLLSISVGPKNK